MTAETSSHSSAGLLPADFPAGYHRLRTLALIAGAAGLVLSAIGYFVDSQDFATSYLFGYFFWFGITIGCLGWLCVHHLTGGNWGRSIQRIAESAAMNLPLMFVLFLPLPLLCWSRLYPWANDFM